VPGVDVTGTNQRAYLVGGTAWAGGQQELHKAVVIAQKFGA
jgi:hypothetical protein